MTTVTEGANGVRETKGVDVVIRRVSDFIVKVQWWINLTNLKSDHECGR